MGLLRGVRALVFDVFGTVVDWRTGVAREAAPFLSRHRATPADPFAFADAWRTGYQPAMEEVQAGDDPSPGCVLHRENLESPTAEIRDRSSRCASSELDGSKPCLASPRPLAGLPRRRLAAIESRFRHGPAFQWEYRPSARIWRSAPACPGGAILGAEVVQAYKPNPEAYLRTAEVLVMRPNEVCLVAAHNGDLAAARECGLRMAFVARPWEHGPDQTSDLQAEQAWDVSAPEFVALADIFDM